MYHFNFTCICVSIIISVLWSFHGLSAQEEFDYVYSTVNKKKKKKKTESEQSKDGSDSTEKEVARYITFHQCKA